jgi:predicted Zn-dependent peptidase
MTTIDRSKPPVIQPIGLFSLPTPRRGSIDNGIPVYFFDNPNLDLIHLLLQVKTGSLYQPKKHVCNFAYSLLRESHPTLSPEELSEKLDYYGTNITVNVGMDQVQIMVSVPKGNMADILPIVAECIISPKYRTESLRIMQDKEIKNLAYNLQKTDYCAWRIMWQEMLGDTFPTVSEPASPDTINAVTVKELEEFHHQSLCAENLRVYVTGNIDSGMEALLRKCWFTVPHGNPSRLPPQLPLRPIPDQPICQPMPGCLQSSIILCRLSMGFNDPDRTGFSVLNTLTGGYFSSRLMQNLRERQGLTYGVSSSSTFFGSQSVFAINSDVNADQTQRAMDSCFEELKRLQEEPVGNDELSMVKNYLAGIQLRAVDTTVNAMQKFAYWKRFGLDETEMARYLAEIQNIKSETIQNLALKYFSYNKFTQIIVGKDLTNE